MLDTFECQSNETHSIVQSRATRTVANHRNYTLKKWLLGGFHDCFTPHSRTRIFSSLRAISSTANLGAAYMILSGIMVGLGVNYGLFGHRAARRSCSFKDGRSGSFFLTRVVDLSARNVRDCHCFRWLFSFDCPFVQVSPPAFAHLSVR
ncbi:uncharacterized protein BO97DRAFT_103505 [Aspergillus homomorphus CBS 101889]|uniref:Uncharacterized protein n=1 Tax=Aspergillus homomorphus (strain CBS 101889) TaxID=1450537 RepID=A0A395HUA3_ASPHC|nr:hypothetical protein BO97DRAFT_103505 [Aspergillus homomorphus CBS 101889]RAL11397.1 hypothetical protein BO97DRAFT_103505 [Aspergillus homomorphus CBS 101889]